MSHTTRDDEPLEDKWDCNAMDSIPFLDTPCSIIEGCIYLDLFKKRNGHQPVFIDQLMPPSSD